MKQLNYEKVLKKELNRYKKDLITEEELTEVFEMVTSGIHEAIQKDKGIGLSMRLKFCMGIHLDRNAKNRILNGDRSAWVLLEKQVVWLSRVIMKAQGNSDLDSREFGGTIGMAMLWGYDELAAGVAAVAEQQFLARPERYRNKQTIHVFMAALWHKHQYGSLPEFFNILPEDHIYQRLMRNWNDEQAFGALLPEACDFHVFSAMDDQRDQMLEILMFDLVPFDIKAIEMTRKKEGLSMPVIEHPLMQSPLAAIPAARPGYDPAGDEILQLVISNEQD